jgi:DNA-binding SARP family transcriptional activator
LLTDYVTALDRLGILLAAAGRLDESIERSRQLLDRDEYREDVHRRVMRCYWQLGRRQEALRQYNRCAALLSDELGLAPLPETEELRTQILAAAI